LLEGEAVLKELNAKLADEVYAKGYSLGSTILRQNMDWS
jgi:hypothetical protein